MSTVESIKLFRQNVHGLYDLADLVRVRRAAVLTARALPIGPERNQQRQIARSVKTLLRNARWVAGHVRSDKWSRHPSSWRLIATAPYDLPIELAVIGRDGPHALAFPCRRMKAGWVDAADDMPIVVWPTHWREPQDLH